jgi:glycosyltransferase involved in cell wall biosynthesis
LHSTTTILLPVHNAERLIRTSILRIQDLAEVLGRRIQLAVVDDGSTDGTFEAVSEVAREYPQVALLRQPCQCGLGPALERVRDSLGAGRIIVHDGSSIIDLHELAVVMSSEAPENLQPATTSESGRGSRRLFTTLTPVSARTHSCAGGSFRWLRLDEPALPRRKASTAATPKGGLPPINRRGGLCDQAVR